MMYANFMENEIYYEVESLEKVKNIVEENIDLYN